MEKFLPLDPDYEARVRASYESLQLLAGMGGRIVSLRPGIFHLDVPYSVRITQQDGFLHAGIAATLLDTACGFAAYTLMPADSRVLTVEFKINLLSPAGGEYFHTEGCVIKPGRTLTVCEGKLFSIEKEKKTLCAIMQATMICIQK
jgi:uncharacterized protein (TIGR00369 family)